MDVIDLKILEELKNDGRMSYNDISKRIGKTEATVRRRVKSLLDDNVINYPLDWLDWVLNKKAHAPLKALLTELFIVSPIAILRFETSTSSLPTMLLSLSDILVTFETLLE